MMKLRKPFLAALASFGAFGLGQLYNGRPKRAVLMYGLGLVVTAIGSIFSPVASLLNFIIFLGVWTCVGLVVVVDAIRDARKLGEVVLHQYNRWYVYLTIFLIHCIVIGPALESLSGISAVKAFKMPAGSMIPTLEIGDRLITDIKAYSQIAPQRGDIIIFKFPEDESKYFIKRVIGLPREKIEVSGKTVLVNGIPLEEKWGYYADFEKIRIKDFDPLVVPEKSYFVLGDNRDHSLDSRFLGAVEGSKIIGKARYIYWSKKWARIGKQLH